MAGYSQTPLVRKLGLRKGDRFYVSGAPVDYAALLGGLPDQAVELSRLGKNLDFIHYFTRSQRDLEAFIPKALDAIKSDGAIWISWPKKSSKLSSDVDGNMIRAVALPTGLVDVKVCAVDETWSGLKLVIRKELR